MMSASMAVSTTLAGGCARMKALLIRLRPENAVS